MYIDKDGLEIDNKLDLIKDILNINMSIDILDIPFSRYGITTNFSKNNYSDTISFISEEVNRIISVNNLSSIIRLKDIKYNDNNKVFTINLDLSGSDYSIKLNEKEK